MLQNMTVTKNEFKILHKYNDYYYDTLIASDFPCGVKKRLENHC